MPGHGVAKISSRIRFAPLSASPSPEVTPACSKTDPRPVECWGTLNRLERLRSGSMSTSNVDSPARDASPAMVICHSVLAVPPFPDSTTTDVAGIRYLSYKTCNADEFGQPDGS